MTVLIDQTFKRPSFEYSIVRILFGVTCQSVRDTSSAFTHHYLMTCMISYKYRPKEKPVVMGIYEVERIVSKRNQGSKAETVFYSVEELSFNWKHMGAWCIASDLSWYPVSPSWISVPRKKFFLFSTIEKLINLLYKKNVLEHFQPEIEKKKKIRTLSLSPKIRRSYKNKRVFSSKRQCWVQCNFIDKIPVLVRAE